MDKYSKQMENNLENKAKFFAIYWGQKVFKWNDAPMKSKVGITHMTKHHLLNMHLELKSVSLITDEDFTEIMWNRFPFQPSFKKGRIYLEHLNCTQCDFIRSKGYAVPFMGASVGELINMGWLKMEGSQDESLSPNKSVKNDQQNREDTKSNKTNMQ